MRKASLVNGALLALGLASLGVVWATRDAPTSAERAERKDKLLPTFRREDVKRLRLARGKDELVLERGPDELRIVKPWAERADIATTQKLLGALELASALRPADGVNREQAGLADGALTITVESSGKPLKLRLGGPAPAPAGARYAQIEADGASQTYVVSQGMASELDVPFDKFRETRLLEYGRSELRAITLLNASGELRLEQREHAAFFVSVDGAWQLARREAVEALLTALARLSSEQLVEVEAARAALGPKPTELRLELFDKSAPAVALRFAPSCPAGPEQALVLLERAGKSRAGCIPSDVLGPLRLSLEDTRLHGPFSARVDEVEELNISRGAERLDLARKDRDFVLRGSQNGDVPLDAGNQRIAAILSAKGAPSDVTFEPFGAVTIQIAGSDEAAHREERVSYGKPRPDGGLCFKRAADGVTLCVDAEAARAFEPDTTLLRSLSVWSFAASDVRSFRVEGKGWHERVVRREDGTYQLEEPKGFAHDGALVANVVQTLGALQAARWVGATDEPRFGFAEPRLHVSVNLADGKPRELLVGAAAPGGYFAKLATEPGVFVLPGLAYADVSTPLIDRSLAPFAEAELESAKLKRRGEYFAVSGPILTSIASLRAEQTVHLGPALPREQLTPPRIRLVLTAKSGKTAELGIGVCDTLNDVSVCYARLSDVDATFAISRRFVDELQDSFEHAH